MKKKAGLLFWVPVVMLVAGLFLSACGDGGNGEKDADGDFEAEVPEDTTVDSDAQDDGGDDPHQEDVPGDEIPYYDTIVDPDAEVDVEPDVVPDAEEEDGGGEGCEDEIAAIAGETRIVGSCSGVVRLDYTTLDILGWQLVCGPYTAVTESDARSQAQTDTGFGSSGNMLNPADPGDEYVFYQAPGDFGGCASVSARTGKSVFGGSIIWMGTGDITYPTTWRSVDTLGEDCPRLPHAVTAVGYNLISGSSLDVSEVDAAVDVVWSTALPEGMATSGYIFDAVVLLYPRAVGAFDPSTAEYIVILNGGWLE